MTATTSTSNFYQVGASLPVDAPSYVRRKADEEFYQKLLDGKFCYVLNSRQMGKSSLRVRTMQRLQKEGRVCAAIDLTGIGKVTEQQWYGGIVYNLSESCQLEDIISDFDWQTWWEKYQGTLSPVQCLSLFIEKVLLANIQEPIVIFVDEIDKILSQDFSLDDFFALIRFFQNQRVDNPIFKRLTFALLGVATPSDLIKNKTQTPFNIGEAIELHGFQIEEVEPLIAGLRGKVNNPQGVMRSILDWTGGQPFLTQKLCQFMVETYHGTSVQNSHGTSVQNSHGASVQNSHGASVQNSHGASVQNSEVVETYHGTSVQNSHGTSVQNSVEEVVRARIIENWESQDDPEHLRTIRDRILSNEQRAGYLLELYQQIQERGEVVANNSVESSELRLSGLVVKRQGKLRVYNQVYQQVFDRGWVEVQLRNLRPYSEAFRAWVASGGKDESRLLRGKALADAEEWAKNKNLSYQDKQFLAASKEKVIQEEIAAKEKEARLERERKDKEAAEQRNQVLSDANNKAKKRIRNGSVVLILALLGAVSLGIFAAIEGNEALKAQKYAETANSKAEEAEKKSEEAEKNLENAQTHINKAKKRVIALEKQTKQAQRKFKDARQEVKKATDKAKEQQEQAQNAQKKAEIAKKETENLQNQLASAKKDFETVQKLSKLAGELHNKNLRRYSDEALRQAGLSFRVDDHNLKQAMLLVSMAQAYQNLVNEYKIETKEQKDKNLEYQKKAEAKIDESLKYLNEKGNISSAQGLQIKAIVKGIQGNLTKEKNKSEAIAVYQEAYDILKNNPTKTNPFTDNQIITAENIESVHKELFKLQPTNKEVRDSLKEHYYTKLEHSLKRKDWREADITTFQLMAVIANRIEQGNLSLADIEQFSCPALENIDNLWVKNSNRNFGFSVQKEIWVKTGNRLGIRRKNWNRSDEENYYRFARAVGWYNAEVGHERFVSSYRELAARRGGLPGPWRRRGMGVASEGPQHGYSLMALRVVKCNI